VPQRSIMAPAILREETVTEIKSGLAGRGMCQCEQAAESATPPWRSMIARRRWFSHRGPSNPLGSNKYTMRMLRFNKEAAGLKPCK
jgi:hypothetical protein